MQNASLEAFLYLSDSVRVPLDASHYQWQQAVNHRGRPRSKVRAGTWSFATSQLDPASYDHLLELMLSPTTVVEARATYGRADGQGTFVTVWGRNCTVSHIYSYFDARGTDGQEPGWTLYFSLAAEEMGRDAGAAGSLVLPAARSYAVTPPASVVGPASDWMEAGKADPWAGKKQSGQAYLGSPPLKRKQLQRLRELARQQYGTDIKLLKDGDEMLNMMRNMHVRAAFQASTKTVFLQPQATYYEAIHELKHAEQCAKLGVEAYAKQSRIEKEMYVYNQLMKESTLTSEETHDAARYINSLRQEAGLPLLTT